MHKLFQNNLVFVSLLAGLFLIAFATPVLFAYQYSGWSSEEEPLPIEMKLEYFPDPLHVNTPGAELLALGQDVSLNPPGGKGDFLVLLWLRVKRLPDPGERFIFLTKYDADTEEKSGYALGLQRDRDAARPVVYWQDEEQSGGWYSFSEVTLLPRLWFLFALSYYDGKFLGLHAAVLPEEGEPEIRLAGGYELEMEGEVQSSAPLIVGSLGEAFTRSQIGALGVFRPSRLERRIDEILLSATKSLAQVPDVFEEEEVVFWTADGITSIGQAQAKMRSGAKRKAGSEKSQ